MSTSMVRRTTLGAYEPDPLGVTLSVAGTALGAYHGYKRNDSVGWAIWWALCGAVFPIITVPVALAQGYGERKVG